MARVTINGWDTEGIRGILPAAYIRPDEFDRWLTQVILDSKELAWDEGVATATAWWDANGPDLPPNPYRTA